MKRQATKPKEKRPSKRLQSTAYHEAGHAVVRNYYDLKQPTRVSIEPDEYSSGRVLGSPLPKGLDPFDPLDWTGQKRLKLESVIKSVLAGSIAQRKFNPRGYRKYHDADDFKKVYAILLHLEGDNEIVSAYYKLLELQTIKLLEQPIIWKKVEAVAQALLQKKEISGRIIRRIITEAAPLKGG